MLERIRARDRAADFVVWHENWPALQTFCACATQWRMIPMGGIQGLDYAALRAVMQMRGVLDQEQAFEDVRLLELGALGAFRKQSLDDLLDG